MSHTTAEIYNTLPPEMKLLLMCSESPINDADLAAFEKLFASAIDWKLFVHLSVHHRVHPVVYRHLKNQAFFTVPEEVLSELQKLSKENAWNALRMTGELMRLLSLLEQRGIAPVVLKGIPLAITLYGDSSLRSCGDLDILVPQKDVEEAMEILDKQGYVPAYSLARTPERFKQWAKSNQHMAYWDMAKGICVELHWRLGYYGWERLLQEDNSYGSALVGGRTVKTLGKEVLLLYLILHGAFHAWARFRWLLDVHLMFRQGNFTWDALDKAADKLGVRHVTNQAIILSQAFWGPSVPTARLEEALRDARAQQLAAMAIPLIMDHRYRPNTQKQEMAVTLQQKKYGFCLLSSWQERLTFLGRLFLPEKSDHELISLPARFYFLYYILSPFTGFKRRLRNAIRRIQNTG